MIGSIIYAMTFGRLIAARFALRKNALSAPRYVDIGARITGATNSYTKRTATRQLTAQLDEQ